MVMIKKQHFRRLLGVAAILLVTVGLVGCRQNQQKATPKTNAKNQRQKPILPNCCR